MTQQHGAPARTGILLINLGTPEAPTAKALRPYLQEFLSDPRVVEIPRLLWWLILHGVILPTRPKKSAEKYGKIWMPEGSPLKVHTELEHNTQHKGSGLSLSHYYSASHHGQTTKTRTRGGVIMKDLTPLLC